MRDTSKRRWPQRHARRTPRPWLAILYRELSWQKPAIKPGSCSGPHRILHRCRWVSVVDHRLYGTPVRGSLCRVLASPGVAFARGEGLTHPPRAIGAVGRPRPGGVLPPQSRYLIGTRGPQPAHGTVILTRDSQTQHPNRHLTHHAMAAGGSAGPHGQAATIIRHTAATIRY